MTRCPNWTGLTVAYLKRSWDILKEDVIRVIMNFRNLHVANFHWLNFVNIFL